MSVRAMSWAWACDGLNMTERLVLLAYADHADHEGRNVYPSLEMVARKCHCSVRHIRRVTRRLEELGCLEADGRAPGVRPDRAPIRYRVPLESDPSNLQARQAQHDRTDPSPRDEEDARTALSGRSGEGGTQNDRTDPSPRQPVDGPVEIDGTTGHPGTDDRTPRAERPDNRVRRTNNRTTKEPLPPPSQLPTTTGAREVEISDDDRLEARRLVVLSELLDLGVSPVGRERARRAETLDELDQLLAEAAG